MKEVFQNYKKKDHSINDIETTGYPPGGRELNLYVII